MPDNSAPAFAWWSASAVCLAAAAAVIGFQWPKGLSIALFVVGGVLAFGGVHSWLRARRELRAPTKPRISVWPDPEGKYLIVRNDGAPAKFWARIRITGQTNCLTTFRDEYDAVWVMSCRTDEDIPHEGTRKLFLGGERNHDSERLALTLYHYSQHIIGVDDSTRCIYPRNTLPGDKPRLQIQVTFTSQPSLVPTKALRQYELTAERINELM